METFSKIVEALPKWVFLIILGILTANIGISYVTGKPFYIAGSPYGWQNVQEKHLVKRDPPINDLGWQQRKYVVDAISQLSPQTAHAAEIISKCYPAFTSTASQNRVATITKEDAQLIIARANADADGTQPPQKLKTIIENGGLKPIKANTNNGPKERADRSEYPSPRELDSSIKLMLNHLESLSSAYLNGVADKDMFEESFKKVIAKWYSKLYLYVEAAGDKCECVWTPFVTLGKEWSEKLPTDTGIQSACVKQPIEPAHEEN